MLHVAICFLACQSSTLVIRVMKAVVGVYMRLTNKAINFSAKYVFFIHFSKVIHPLCFLTNGGKLLNVCIL